jgi:predicted DNA-binding WGR domain protein
MVTILGHRPVYWECVVDGHSKFWAAQIIEETQPIIENNKEVIYKKYKLVRKWGAIGTEGQTMEQDFEDMYDAERALDKLIWDKERKGYKPIF